MIKFIGRGPKGYVLGLGLSALNVQRLKEDKPILFDLEDLGYALIPLRKAFSSSQGAGQVTIVYGETEPELAEKLGFGGAVANVEPGREVRIRFDRKEGERG